VTLLALALAACCVAYAFSTLVRCRRAAAAFAASKEDDPFEQRLAEKELRLVVSLGRRSVLALGRAALFGGTGLGVWALTGGSAHYLDAGVAFGLGFVSWACLGELQRRIGSLADLPRRSSSRQGVDQSKRTG
jgi:hypothetical protein